MSRLVRGLSDACFRLGLEEKANTAQHKVFHSCVKQVTKDGPRLGEFLSDNLSRHISRVYVLGAGLGLSRWRCESHTRLKRSPTLLPIESRDPSYQLKSYKNIHNRADKIPQRHFGESELRGSCPASHNRGQGWHK